MPDLAKTPKMQNHDYRQRRARVSEPLFIPHLTPVQNFFITIYADKRYNNLHWTTVRACMLNLTPYQLKEHHTLYPAG